jgi:hypothetical protein
MQMPEKARVEESETYPIIFRSFEPVADLDDRLQRILTVLSLPPLEESSAQGPRLTRLATRATGDVTEPPLGMGSGDRCGDSEGDSGVSEAGDAERLNSGVCREDGFSSAIPRHGNREANPPW